MADISLLLGLFHTYLNTETLRLLIDGSTSARTITDHVSNFSTPPSFLSAPLRETENDDSKEKITLASLFLTKLSLQALFVFMVR